MTAVNRIEGNGAVLRDITRRYYAMWWGYAFAGGFLYGVYPLFLRSRGLDQFEINSVLACYFVVMFLTDVPTGAFADAMGRRRSFVLGCATRVAAFTVYFFAHHFLVFVIAECIDGIGTTLCNGAIDAWGVDALDAAGFDGIKDRLFSRISQLTNFGFMGAAIIGAYVADFNIALPWILGAAGFAMAGMAAIYLMREDHREQAYRAGAPRIRLDGLYAQVAARVMTGLRQGFHTRTVLMLSSASALTFAAWAPYWLEWPQLFNDRYGVGIWIVGWLYSSVHGRANDRRRGGGAHRRRSARPWCAACRDRRRRERAAVRGGRDGSSADRRADKPVRDEPLRRRDAAAHPELVQRTCRGR